VGEFPRKVRNCRSWPSFKINRTDDCSKHFWDMQRRRPKEQECCERGHVVPVTWILFEATITPSVDAELSRLSNFVLSQSTSAKFFYYKYWFQYIRHNISCQSSICCFKFVINLLVKDVMTDDITEMLISFCWKFISWCFCPTLKFVAKTPRISCKKSACLYSSPRR